MKAVWVANQYKVTYDDVAWQKIQIKVTLDYNGADKENSEIVLYAGDKLTYELAGKPWRTEYIFRGWFTDKECTQLYKFNTSITDDITLYAGWQATVNHYTGSYFIPKHNGYNNYDITEYNSESNRLTMGAHGSSDDANYLYINANESGTHKIYYYCSNRYARVSIRIYNFTKQIQIDGDTWSDDYYSYQCVEFDCDEGDVIAVAFWYGTGWPDMRFYFEGFTSYKSNTANVDIPSGEELAHNDSQSHKETITFGETVEMPIPVRKGYTFDGWYYNGKKVENGEWNIDEDVILTAKWIAN